MALPALQRLPSTDFGLDWQSQMMNQLNSGLPAQMTGGVNPVNMNDIIGFYDRGVGFGDYPTSTQAPAGWQFLFPTLGQGASTDPSVNIEEKNKLVRDVRGRFTPLYYNASAEGYTAPVGKAGPGGVLFNSGLGKTNENPGDYKTPGAGLWAAGFDPNDPFVVQKVYDYFSKNRGPVWDKYKPQKDSSGAWVKGNADEALNFLTEADHWLRQEATKMDLPKRGITDSFVGNLLVGGLVSAFTGGLGTIISGLTSNAAIGNIASALASAGIGGATGGLQGAITGGIGSAIGSGVDFAGGIGEFIQNPLESLSGAFDIAGNSAGSAVGGLLNLDNSMANAAQVGPGSLAQVTPASSIGQSVISTDVIGGIPHEVIEVVGNAGDVAQVGSGLGSSVGGAIGSALGGMFGGGSAGPTGVGGTGTTPWTGDGTTPGTGTGAGTGTTTGGTTGGGTGLLDQTSPGNTGGTTGGTTTPIQETTPVQVGSQEWLNQLLATQATTTPMLPESPVNQWANSGLGQVQNFVTPQPQVPEMPQLGSQEWLNQVLATQATSSPMLPENPVNSWANSGTGQVQDFSSPQTSTTPELGSQEWLNAILAGGSGLGGNADLTSPVNSWAFGGTGVTQNFATPGVDGGGGTGIDAGTGLGGGTGIGDGIGDGPGLLSGSGTGIGDGTGPGTGSGVGDGTGLGTNNPLDFGLPDLSMLGGGQGSLGEATGSGIYGGKMGGFEAKYPKTPKKKKRGITVQIAGARRNA